MMTLFPAETFQTYLRKILTKWKVNTTSKVQNFKFILEKQTKYWIQKIAHNLNILIKKCVLFFFLAAFNIHARWWNELLLKLIIVLNKD